MSLVAATVAVIGAGAIGLAEDLHGLSVLHRLVLQGVLVTAVAVMLTSDSGGTALVLVLASFSGVFYVNTSNFMDGINGLSAAQGILVGVYFAALGVGRGDTYAFAAGIIIAVSCTAFVPWNFPTARMFLGDVGSYALGAGAWALAVWSVVAGASPAVAVAPFTILVVDVVWTLLDRARHHRPLTSPHRQHIYQQLASITSHGYATSLVAGFTLVCASAGALHAYDRLPKVALILVLVVMGILYVCAAVPVTDVLVGKLERIRNALREDVDPANDRRGV